MEFIFFFVLVNFEIILSDFCEIKGIMLKIVLLEVWMKIVKMIKMVMVVVKLFIFLSIM